MATIGLQCIGNVPAVPLSEIKIGDTLVWNYGTKTKVLGLRPVGKKSIEVTEESEKPFNMGTAVTKRRMLATRLVCRGSDLLPASSPKVTVIHVTD